MTPPTCATCQCWLPRPITLTDEDGKEAMQAFRGECRRFPPAVLLMDARTGNKQSVFPTTFAGWKCWEWRPMPDGVAGNTAGFGPAIPGSSPGPATPEVSSTPEVP